jgi:hypothetical protein
MRRQHVRDEQRRTINAARTRDPAAVAAAGVGVTGVPPPVLDRLPTPCLVVDSAAASRNIQRCAAFFSGQRTALRPHFKAHKCTTLMRQQLAAGGCSGVACQTSWEALVLAAPGRLGFGLASRGFFVVPPFRPGRRYAEMGGWIL